MGYTNVFFSFLPTFFFLVKKKVWWRWWESNPRPLWIKTDFYECSYLLSRIKMENNKTWLNSKTFFGSLTSNGNLDTHTIFCVLRLACLRHPQRQAGQVRRLTNCDYAALFAALGALKSTAITLSAFNLICSLITENSARTRNQDLPITASKPVHPHD